MRAKELVIITGMSGSGKSTALDAFEDMGYFCVDNLPAPLVANFTDFLIDMPETWSSRPRCRAGKRSAKGKGKGETEAGAEANDAPSEADYRFALLVDCRERESFPHVKSGIERLRDAEIDVRLLFFDSQDEVLIRRYQETRRPHPLLVGESSSQTIADALLQERELLSIFRAEADLVIDTTPFSPHDIRRYVQDHTGESPQMRVYVESFGFRYGVPHDIDLVADVRFLPNPHFVPQLREFDGTDDRVADYVFQGSEANEFIRRYSDLLEFLVPRYQKEGKRYLKIGVGCTGGKHRSVAISRKLADHLTKQGFTVSVSHRDRAKSG